jgi:hydroxyacylglutathione hydrolase
MSGPLCVRNGVFGSNSYLCPTSSRGECVLVDPGLDAAAIDEAIARSGLRPRAVLCTHGHFDHVGSAREYQRRFAIPVYLHRADARTANASNFLMMAFKVPARVVLPDFTLVDDGFSVEVSGEQVRYLHAPGHTPGSCVILCAGHAFTGDTIYRDGVGLVSLPGEDGELLRRSVLDLWSSLPEELLVNPGHGGSATLGDIKRHNRPLRQFLGVEP